MNAEGIPASSQFRSGYELGKLYGEVRAYLRDAGEDEDGPLTGSFLTLLEALGEIPEAAPAIAKAVEVWEKH